LGTVRPGESNRSRRDEREREHGRKAKLPSAAGDTLCCHVARFTYTSTRERVNRRYTSQLNAHCCCSCSPSRTCFNIIATVFLLNPPAPIQAQSSQSSCAASSFLQLYGKPAVPISYLPVSFSSILYESLLVVPLYGQVYCAMM